MVKPGCGKRREESAAHTWPGEAEGTWHPSYWLLFHNHSVPDAGSGWRDVWLAVGRVTAHLPWQPEVFPLFLGSSAGAPSGRRRALGPDLLRCTTRFQGEGPSTAVSLVPERDSGARILSLKKLMLIALTADFRITFGKYLSAHCVWAQEI